jgi:hypothetical protein
MNAIPTLELPLSLVADVPVMIIGTGVEVGPVTAIP